MVNDLDEDDGDGSSTALARPVDTKRLVVARSLADARPGEMVFVNRRGQSMPARRVAFSRAVAWTTIASSGLVTGLIYGTFFSSATIGLIAGAFMQSLALFKLRHWPAFRAAIAYVAASRWEEARSALLALEGKRLRAYDRYSVQLILAAVEGLLGQPQESLDRLERAQASVAGWRAPSRVMRCQAASLRAAALATLGRVGDARRARDELVREAAAATGGRDRPRGDYLDMLVQGTELKIAVEADAPDTLPDDDTLHRWARAALGRSRFGELLVSLAWAFHRRGDDDMARHLLAEAPSRIPRWSLRETSPRLDAWAREKAREWDQDWVNHL
jgi:hypothetical protein